MSNVRKSSRLEEKRAGRLVIKTIAGLLTFCAMLIVATQIAMGYVVRSSMGEHAAQMSRAFVMSTLNVLPEFAGLTDGGAASPWQVSILKGRMQGSDVTNFALFDTEGRLLLSVARSGLGFKTTGSVNSAARAAVRDGLSWQRGSTLKPEETLVDHHHENMQSHIDVLLPVDLANGQTLVVNTHVDVTRLSTNLRRRLDFYSIFLILGGLLAYGLPAVALAWRTGELRRRDQALLRLSRRDNLTGLLNRGCAANAFTSVLPERKEDNVTLFYLDLDQFKSINDTMGHGAGDQILTRLGDILKKHTAEGDIAARFGGDEFVLVRRHPEGETDDQFAAAILADVDKPLDVLGQRVRPGISIGGYRLLPGDSFDDALRAADLALYEAKSRGRGQYARHTASLMRRRERRHAVERRMRAAIAMNAFYLEYQPIYCGRAERLMGFEALLRLKDDAGAVISPGEFIPVAEEAGLIKDLGQLALRNALEVAKDWPDDIFVAVNVSALQFGGGDFPSLVEAELERSGVRAGRLELELTESALLSDGDTIDIEIAELKALGCQLALDDFGTGYSSLAYLWRLPFDKVKIDRAFLEGFEYDREKYSQFISTVVLLGRQMGMKVTAEGLETTDQLSMLENMGVQGYQGYLLGRPLPERIATDYAHRRPPPALMVLDGLLPEEGRRNSRRA